MERKILKSFLSIKFINLINYVVEVEVLVEVAVVLSSVTATATTATAATATAIPATPRPAAKPPAAAAADPPAAAPALAPALPALPPAALLLLALLLLLDCANAACALNNIIAHIIDNIFFIILTLGLLVKVKVYFYIIY
jgi:hypothetical protein